MDLCLISKTKKVEINIPHNEQNYDNNIPITKMKLAGYFDKFELVTISAVEFIATQWNSEFTCKMIKINFIQICNQHILQNQAVFVLSFLCPFVQFCLLYFFVWGGGGLLFVVFFCFVGGWGLLFVVFFFCFVGGGVGVIVCFIFLF